MGRGCGAGQEVGVRKEVRGDFRGPVQFFAAEEHMVTISEEKLIEMLERAYLAGWAASGEGWNDEYPGDAEYQEQKSDRSHVVL